jgi:hypothetical protein
MRVIIVECSFAVAIQPISSKVPAFVFHEELVVQYVHQLKFYFFLFFLRHSQKLYWYLQLSHPNFILKFLKLHQFH